MNETEGEKVQQETVQTVHSDKEQASGKAPYIEVSFDDMGYWHWMLWSGNGRPMATNAVGYKTRDACTDALKSIKEILKEEKLRVTIVHP